MDARAILTKKRDGGELSREEIEFFLRGVVSGDVADYLASALLAIVFVRGFTPRELEHWTGAMLNSGEKLDLSRVDLPIVDKHSTGGIGDKVSIALAPALAACGVAVPMISGRGLGHTGGTLDKLESIPGFRTKLESDEFVRAVEQNGVAFGEQTDRIAPADRVLYALRDVTGLIESIPLIASSILSKKLAEDLDALVLDVKFGSGAFLREPERGAELARCMLAIARSFGLAAVAYQTAMDRPLGLAAGNALEIQESIECLCGRGPDDLRALVCIQGGELLFQSRVATSRDDGFARMARALDNGGALERFRRVIEAQGGDPRCLTDRSRLPRAPDLERVEARSSGVLAFGDLRELGQAITELGGGRLRLGDSIDPAVGLVFAKRAGERVERGDLLVTIHHRGGRGLESARARLERSIAVAEHVELTPLVLARIDA